MTRISSYNLHQTLLRDTTNAQTTLYDLQNQLSSGQKSNTYQGLGNSVQSYVDLNNKLNSTQTYIDSGTIVTARLNTADNALNSIISTANDIQNLIGLQRTASSGTALAFQTQLEGKWQQLTDQLNTSYEGRYLFSGTRTDVPAVDTTAIPTLQVDGVPDAGYYKGSQQNVTTRVGENNNIDFSVRADDPAFQKLMAGIALAYKYGQAAGDSTQMGQAFDLMKEGTDGVISLRATVNANKVSVSSNVDQLNALKLYWKGLKEGISNTDIVAVSTEVAITQGILQAAYQAFARISSLKLSDFLN